MFSSVVFFSKYVQGCVLFQCLLKPYERGKACDINLFSLLYSQLYQNSLQGDAGICPLLIHSNGQAICSQQSLAFHFFRHAFVSTQIFYSQLY